MLTNLHTVTNLNDNDYQLGWGGRMLSFKELEEAVRAAKPMGQHSVIRCYVHMGLEKAKNMNSCDDTKAVHLRIVDTLTETMCDSCLNTAWRNNCFRVLKQLIPLLHVILNTDEFQRKMNEIHQLAHYFLGAKIPSQEINKIKNNQPKQ